MKYLVGGLLLLLISAPLIAQDSANKGQPIKIGDAKQAEGPRMIKVHFNTSPPGLSATVHHGKDELGVTPFKHEFEYNSGPVDVAFKCPGYFTVNTRVRTMKSGMVIVKMTKLEDAKNLYGYKEKIPPDGGVPEAASGDGDQPGAKPATPPAPAKPNTP